MSDTANVTFVQQPETGANPPPAAPQTPAQRDDGQPGWLPPQFKTPEDFAKNWNDQRSEITRLQQGAKKADEKPADAPADKKPNEALKIDDKPAEGLDPKNPNEATDDAAKNIVQQSGMDMAPYLSEWQETGDVSPENRAKIAEGLKAQLGENAEAIVNDYIEGQKARQANFNAEVTKMAGGEEAANRMMLWAKDVYTPEEKAAFNKALNSGDLVAAKMAIEGIRGRFEREQGLAPELLTGDNAIGGDTGAFASTYEMTQAMGDPRYKSDPVYRKQVEQRAMKSNF